MYVNSITDYCVFVAPKISGIPHRQNVQKKSEANRLTVRVKLAIVIISTVNEKLFRVNNKNA